MRFISTKDKLVNLINVSEIKVCDDRLLIFTTNNNEICHLSSVPRQVFHAICDFIRGCNNFNLYTGGQEDLLDLGYCEACIETEKTQGTNQDNNDESMFNHFTP